MKNLIRNFYQSNYRFRSFKILGRVSCLGSEIINQLGFTKGLLNHQKSRVDFLLELSENEKIKPDTKEVFKFLKLKYMSGIIKQQEFDFFKRKKPDLIIFDSFSELTDQLFENKQNSKQFLSNYTDIEHNDDFQLLYTTKGLIDLTKIDHIYDIFFQKLTMKFSSVPIVFIHFPSKFDNRNKFKVRGEKIKNAIDELSKKYPYLYSISLNDSLVTRADEDIEELKDFPYHYGTETYSAYVIEIKKVLDKHKWNLNGN